MLSLTVLNICRPVIENNELDEEERADRLLELLSNEPLCLTGKALEGTALQCLWHWKKLNDRTLNAPSADSIAHGVSQGNRKARWKLEDGNRSTTPQFQQAPYSRITIKGYRESPEQSPDLTQCLSTPDLTFEPLTPSSLQSTEFAESRESWTRLNDIAGSEKNERTAGTEECSHVEEAPKSASLFRTSTRRDDYRGIALAYSTEEAPATPSIDISKPEGYSCRSRAWRATEQHPVDSLRSALQHNLNSRTVETFLQLQGYQFGEMFSPVMATLDKGRMFQHPNKARKAAARLEGTYAAKPVKKARSIAAREFEARPGIFNSRGSALNLADTAAFSPL